MFGKGTKLFGSYRENWDQVRLVVVLLLFVLFCFTLFSFQSYGKLYWAYVND